MFCLLLVYMLYMLYRVISLLHHTVCFVAQRLRRLLLRDPEAGVGGRHAGVGLESLQTTADCCC